MEPPAPVSAAFSVRVVKFIINAFWYGTWISLVIRLAALVTGGSFKGEDLGSLSGFLDSIAFETPAWSDALPIVSSLVVLWILYHLRCFFRVVANGNPFVTELPKRTRLIAYSIIAWKPVMGVVSAWFRFMDSLPGPHGYLGLQGSTVELIFVGLVILAIAHIFDVGVRLQEAAQPVE